jgi:hypothetical protein
MSKKKVEKKSVKKSKKKKVKVKNVSRGRPRVEIDWDKLNVILQFKPTREVCSDILGVSHDTLEARIREKYDCTFQDYRARKMAPVKIRLVKTAIEKAMRGDNTMLIFCLKNLCGWADKPLDRASGDGGAIANLVLNIPTNNRE